MFENATLNVGISQRVVATLVACAVVLMSVGIYNTAQAANLVSVSDTLSDSAPGAQSGHSIEFTIPTGESITGTDTVTIDFPDFSTVNNVAGGDVTVTVNGTPDAHANFAQSGTNISFDGVAATQGQVVVVAITSGNITNPAVGSYQISISTEAGETGKTRVAIVSTVLVQAIVNTTFTFTVTGMATSSVVNGVTLTGSSSPTSINYGTLAAGVPEALGQRLNVTTNANNGFAVTVESDGDLESANGAVIDNFDDGSDVADPAGTTWNAPGNNINDETTWGHWGVTTSDSDLNSLGGFYTSEFAANEFIAASTSPREIFHHNGPADGTTANMGSTTVAYRVQISPLQEAADDYNTTLTYIATPTF